MLEAFRNRHRPASAIAARTLITDVDVSKVDDVAALVNTISMPTTWQDIEGHFNYSDLYDRVLSEIPRTSVIVEIGCWLGRSTIYLATQIKKSEKEIAFYAIDHGLGTTRRGIPRATTAGALAANIVECGVEDAVVQIVAPSHRAVRLFHDGEVDFCFIDGAHDFESVARDVKDWWPKIRIGGLLAGHDYTKSWPGVRKAVNQFFGVEDCTDRCNACCWSVRKSDGDRLYGA